MSVPFFVKLTSRINSKFTFLFLPIQAKLIIYSWDTHIFYYWFSWVSRGNIWFHAFGIDLFPESSFIWIYEIDRNVHYRNKRIQALDSFYNSVLFCIWILITNNVNWELIWINFVSSFTLGNQKHRFGNSPKKNGFFRYRVFVCSSYFLMVILSNISDCLVIMGWINKKKDIFIAVGV